MRLEITGRHLTITPAARTAAERRVAHTLRLLNNSAVSAHVVLTQERTRVRAELSLHVKHEHFLHAEALGPNPQTAIAAAAEKIERQAAKLKGKWGARKRKSLPTAAAVASGPDGTGPRTGGRAATPPRANGAPGPRIIRARRYAVKPMSIEDAAAEVGDGTDAVIVFRNSATDTMTVLFRRSDGNLGLIEPEA
ncbi:MAG TPA: ribosome-associated translation inhibitor RaiA [Vicinamibacterales bacterium]|nr:ribosome-associated translation inhibitor RaiA [Vicinamibacterales bacterium]